MKHWMRLCILLLAFLLLMAPAAMAYEIPNDFTGKTLEEVVEEFMQANNLDETNFSVSYYNTVTGERYAFNDKRFMVAGSTYKLPLNMYYYELEQEGTMAPDAYISRAGAALNIAHEHSLVYSDNDMSIGLLYNLGEFRDYKNAMKKYFTMPEEEIDPIYYTGNYYCTNMMMDALMYLYEYRADFEEMIGYMKLAQPGEYFKAGVTEYEVAHKYGWFDGAVNDVGIIYTPQPILLAVYTQFVTQDIVAEAAALFTAYTLWQDPPVQEQGTQKLELELTYEPQEPVQEVFAPQEQAEEPLPEQIKQTAFEWWMIAVSLGVFLLGGGIVLLSINPKRQKKHEK